ncbi:MAG: hypothetical protein WA655_16175 [Candidatus Korobacteraceae bacterium]
MVARLGLAFSDTHTVTIGIASLPIGDSGEDHQSHDPEAIAMKRSMADIDERAPHPFRNLLLTIAGERAEPIAEVACPAVDNLGAPEASRVKVLDDTAPHFRPIQVRRSLTLGPLLTLVLTLTVTRSRTDSHDKSMGVTNHAMRSSSGFQQRGNNDDKSGVLYYRVCQSDS